MFNQILTAMTTKNNQNSEKATILFNQYHSAVLNFILFRYNLTKEVAEDIASEVFIKVFNSIHTFDKTKSNVKTWLFNIAKNTTIDYFRRNSNKKPLYIETLTHTAKDEHIFTFEPQTAEQADSGIYREELQDKINIAANKLLPLQKQLLQLHLIEGYKISEIAIMLNISEGTIKGNLNRLRATMQTELLNLNIFA